MKPNLLVWFLFVALVVTYLLHVNPLHFWMPDMAGMLLTSIFCISLLGYLALFWRESPRDERELEQVRIADRYGYLAANGVLLVGILAQMIHHESDFWLLTTALIMNTVKILSQHLLNRHEM